LHFIYFKNPKKYKCLKNMAKTCFRQKMIISWNYGLKLVDTWFLAKLKRFGNLVKIDRQCWYHCFFYFWGLSDQKSKMILKQKIPPQTPPLLAPPPSNPPSPRPAPPPPNFIILWAKNCHSRLFLAQLLHFIYFKNPKKYKCLKNRAKTCFRQKKW